jgi:hypothetical protein
MIKLRDAEGVLMRTWQLALIATISLGGCASERLTQFSSFAAAGSQYVHNFHQLTAEAGTAMIASDSSVLITARNEVGNAIVNHVPEYTSEVQKQDEGLEQYLTTLQALDAHATLLGSYFTAITALTNGTASTQAGAAADSFLDSINALNPEIEKATIRGQPIKNFVQPAATLIVDTFAVKALEEQLKKAAPIVDQALTLQEAAVAALTTQLKSSQAASLEIRESTDVINPYVSAGALPASWAGNREAFVQDEVTIAGVSSAQAAIAQLHTAFKQLVQNKQASPDFATLLSQIEKMTAYVSALKSSSTTPAPAK